VFIVYGCPSPARLSNPPLAYEGEDLLDRVLERAVVGDDVVGVGTRRRT
jgi:hypothetical protein